MEAKTLTTFIKYAVRATEASSKPAGLFNLHSFVKAPVFAILSL